MQWQYHHLSWKWAQDDGDPFAIFDEHAPALGAEGWELVTVAASPKLVASTTASHVYTAVFKRLVA